MGCIIYYVLSNGKHPFGQPTHCQANIADGNVIITHSDLNGEDQFTIEDLVKAMIDKDKDLRYDFAKYK